MYVVAVLLLAVAGGLIWAAQNKERRLSSLAATECTNASALRTMASSMAEGLGTGHWSYRAELQGTIRCDEPLTSELAEKPCVYYHSKVVREYEEEVETKGSDGEAERKTRRGSDTLTSNRRHVRFELEDATGRVEIDPGGAEITAVKEVSRFEDREPRGFQIPTLGPNRKTLGYRYEEHILPVGHEIYVVGEACDRHGDDIRVVAPKDGEMIVSVEGEEAVERKLGKSATGLRTASKVFGVLGALALLVAIL